MLKSRFLNAIIQEEEPGILGKINSRTEQAKQDDCGASCGANQQQNNPQQDCVKYRNQHKTAPNGQS